MRSILDMGDAGSSSRVQRSINCWQPFNETSPTNVRELRNGRIDLLAIDPEFLERLLCTLDVKLSVPGQSRQRCRNNRFSVHFEVPPQMFAIVAASEAISAESDQPPAQ